MNQKKSLMLIVFIALGIALACGQQEEPPATQLDSEPTRSGDIEIETPGPVVDLEPDPLNKTVWVWMATAQSEEPSIPAMPRQLKYMGSVFDTMDAHKECDFREDLIGGLGVPEFSVVPADGVTITDGKKVRLHSKDKDDEKKIELTIEWDVAGKKLNWVIDDTQDRMPACTMRPVKTFSEDHLPVELQNLLVASLEETSAATPRKAKDFRFEVQYEKEDPKPGP